MSAKRCSKCGESKPLSKFYPNANGLQGVMPYCKTCDNTRARKPSALKINRMRARHRALADLVDFHREEFEALLSIRLAEAKDEAEALAATPEAQEHYKTGEPVRLKPGKRMAGERVADRIDVARCPHCIKHHDKGHVCAACGARPTLATIKNLDSRSPAVPPSGMRKSSTLIDADALAAFNAGTARANAARR